MQIARRVKEHHRADAEDQGQEQPRQAVRVKASETPSEGTHSSEKPRVGWP